MALFLARESSHVTASASRAAAVRAGVRVEVVTIAWMLIEAAVAIGAGLLARSLLLTAFGIDSVIELLTGGILLWRLMTELQGGSLQRVERAENRAAWLVGISLCALCLYIIGGAISSLLTLTRSEAAPAGIVLAVVAVIGMPLLARRKRTIAAQIESAALRGDAACSITCAYMAATLLIGLALNALLHWWWADSVAALVFLYWLAREAREALEGARAGQGACSCGETECAD